jgi:hypothetical protein
LGTESLCFSLQNTEPNHVRIETDNLGITHLETIDAELRMIDVKKTGLRSMIGGERSHEEKKVGVGA